MTHYITRAFGPNTHGMETVINTPVGFVTVTAKTALDLSADPDSDRVRDYISAVGKAVLSAFNEGRSIQEAADAVPFHG